MDVEDNADHLQYTSVFPTVLNNFENEEKKESKIQSIDNQSSSKICSAQVILNLAVAVKELVENSLDAGSSRIEVSLKEYGSDCIEVSDNGSGVAEKDFQALTLKHHTSKLRDFSDISFVETFGFRGEALNSLCALGELSITTRHMSSSCATRLDFDHNGIITRQVPCARQIGTTVCIKNLFVTFPVRHKDFLRNLKKEFSKMVEILYAYCLISTGVRITCVNQLKKGNRVTIVCTQGSLKVRDNIACVFGSKQVHGLMELLQVPPSVEVLLGLGLPERMADVPCPFTFEGFVSSCAHGEGRAAPDRQFFYVNFRPCEPSQVIKAVNDVYHIFNKRQYPFVFMNIKTEKTGVDVNLTPDKRQVLLNQEKLLVAAVKGSLLKLYEAVPSTLKINNIPVFGESSPSSEQTLVDFNNLQQWRRSPGTPQSSKKGLKRTLEVIRVEKRNKSKQVCLNSYFSGSSVKETNMDSDNDETVCNILENNMETTTCSVVNQIISEKDDVCNTVYSTSSGLTCDPTMSEITISDNGNANTEFKESIVNLCTSSMVDPFSIKGSDQEFVECENIFVPEPLPWSVDIQFVAEQMANAVQDEGHHQEENPALIPKFKAQINSEQNNLAEQELRREITKDMFAKMRIVGQFNKGFIITHLESDLFIIDQHASDEIYNFEILQKNTSLQNQKLVVPQKLDLTYVKESLLIENIDIFRKNGFDFIIDETAPPTEKVKLSSIPISKNWTFGKEDVDELLFMLEEAPHTMCRPSRVRGMFASRACRKAVMIGTDLSMNEMRKIVDHMGEMDSPWNCPHGRPTMRHLVNFSIFFNNRIPDNMIKVVGTL